MKKMIAGMTATRNHPEISEDEQDTTNIRDVTRGQKGSPSICEAEQFPSISLVRYDFAWPGN